MEQPRLLIDKHDAALFGSTVDSAVLDRAPGSCDILCAGLVGAEDVIYEGELQNMSEKSRVFLGTTYESIARQHDIRLLLHPVLPLFIC